MACMSSLLVFDIYTSQFLMKLGRHVIHISKIILKLSYHFKHLEFSKLSSGDSSPTLTLTDGEDSKADKMSSTHPNSNMSYVLDSISQEELVGKRIFLYFEFDQLRHLNPNFIVDQNLQIAISQILPIQSQI